MKAPTLPTTEVVRDRLEALEAVLPELTLAELRHLLDVLQRKSGEISRRQVELVVREIEGRKFVGLQASMALP